jgi:hypothetical protein
VAAIFWVSPSRTPAVTRDPEAVAPDPVAVQGCYESCPEYCSGNPCEVAPAPEWPPLGDGDDDEYNSSVEDAIAPGPEWSPLGEGDDEYNSSVEDVMDAIETSTTIFEECVVTGDADPCLWPGGCPEGEEYEDGCCYVIDTPVILDLAGDGIKLTNIHAGVLFAIGKPGAVRQVSWTYPESDDAWLALDRDGDGRITSGVELFGDETPQPVPPAGRRANGFEALAVFDMSEQGGNGDLQITEADDVFRRLVVWQDRNHNGDSEPDELMSLEAAGVAAINLRYLDSRRVDMYGNVFRYRTRVRPVHRSSVARWAYDVILQGRRF